ncbi:hypothetical protein HOY80DRAFT_1114545 [Tuber brumale]|nr:hypothetical protein HOY80DRAFT_1114545 [Tuber brumale]
MIGHVSLLRCRPKFFVTGLYNETSIGTSSLVRPLGKELTPPAFPRAMNLWVPEMNIVSLCLSSEVVNGSVATGGFGEGLIDHGDKMVFSEANVNYSGFVVTIASIMYIRGWGGGKETEVRGSARGGAHVVLSYNSSQLRLPLGMPTPLLPLPGSPSYDKGMNGYVYTSILPADYTLRVTLPNGIPTIVVSIPATSPITTDPSTDNTLTSQHVVHS